MFSHKINNPNNTIIKNDYYVIPFGQRCTPALACKYANIRKFSLPFDWNIPLLPNKIQNVLENNFDDFIPDVKNNIFNNKYDICLAHFNSNINDGIDEYKRRIDRFNNIINQSKKIYFIYINEDYLYNEQYRRDDFNDNIFNEMLELEKFIKNKYINIDYNILYFNFKHHNIPINSNIINIVLNSTNLYEKEQFAPYEEFRNYCGEILAKLFNTNLTIGYDCTVFSDYDHDYNSIDVLINQIDQIDQQSQLYYNLRHIANLKK